MQFMRMTIMNKKGKRFVALLIVFMSIMSFLPIKLGLNGQAVKAFDSSATDIEVGGDGNEAVDSSKKPIYSTVNESNYFTISVKDLRIQNDSLITDLNKATITGQEV